jgi:hypothetical protein
MPRIGAATPNVMEKHLAMLADIDARRMAKYEVEHCEQIEQLFAQEQYHG